MQSSRIVEIRKTVRGAPPRIPFEHIARDILGGRYRLSLVLCGDLLSRRINREYREPRKSSRSRENKSYSPNVLSFPLEKREGEIFLNVRKAAREARAMRIEERTRIARLFAHGCFHLKGLGHGDKMDREEEKILERFGFR